MIVFLSILVLWVISLCLHEYGHARVAYAAGDTSVEAKGYLSMNPLAYMHPVTSLLIPLLILAIGGVPLPGGAVYIDRTRLRSRHWDALVSLAGPAANIGLFVLAALPFRLGFYEPGVSQSLLWPTLAFFAYLQAAAALFNLLPVPGLDGFGILGAYLPGDFRARAESMSTMFFVMLIIVLMNDNPVSDAFHAALVRLPLALGVHFDALQDGYLQFRSAMPFR